MLKKIILSAFLGSSVVSVYAQTLPVIKKTRFKKDTFDIRKFGAKSDALFNNAQAINAAISACSKKGGGVVLVPNGHWFTGPIVLQSNVNLSVSRAAILQFSDNMADYKLVLTNWEGLKAVRNQSPISAENAENIAITGSGIIDGNGDKWRMVKKDKLAPGQWKRLVESGGLLSEDKKTWYPSASSLKGSSVKNAGVWKENSQLSDFDSIKDFLRPNLLFLNNCKRVLLEGVTFQNSPAWCLHPMLCEDLTVKNIYAKNPWYAQNGDGIDVESCDRFIIDNSTFDVGDDGICIKSGRDEQGRKRGKPSQNGIVKNCVVYHAHGGFVIGSEMSGGAKNIFVDNCSFIGTDIGLRFKTTRGRGGVVENIYVNNINMSNIVGEAILFDMYYSAKDPVPLPGEKRELPKVEELPVTEATPQFKNFYVKNITCDGAEKAIFIRGLPEMNIQHIYLSNLVMQSKHGVVCEEAKNIEIKQAQFICSETNPLFSIQNSSALTFTNITYNKAKLLAKAMGSKCKQIVFKNTSTQAAEKQLEMFDDVEKDAVKFE